MKRTKKAAAILLCIALTLALLAGCGGGSPAGKYYIKTIGGLSIEDYLVPLISAAGLSLDEVLKTCGIGSLDEFITIELKEDGTAVTIYADAASGGLELSPRTWKKSGSKILITSSLDGQTAEYTLKGAELSITTNGVEYVLVKK